MRGTDRQQATMFSYVSPERRAGRSSAARACGRWSMTSSRSCRRRFDALYATVGRPSIAPEKLLRALLLQVLYTCAASGS